MEKWKKLKRKNLKNSVNEQTQQPEIFCKKVVLKVLLYSQEDTYVAL